MARKQPVCCLRCGRDTMNKSGYCKGCIGGRSDHKPPSEDDDWVPDVEAWRPWDGDHNGLGQINQAKEQQE